MVLPWRRGRGGWVGKGRGIKGHRCPESWDSSTAMRIQPRILQHLPMWAASSCTRVGEDLITLLTAEPLCCILETNKDRISMILQPKKTFKWSYRSRVFNPFSHWFQSMVNASYADYNGLSISENLDQQSVKLQNKTHVSSFRWPLLEEKDEFLSAEPREGGSKGRGGVQHSREPVQLDEL